MCIVESLEDALLWNTIMIEVGIISAMSVARTRSKISTIRVCGTRNRTEPTVKQHEILGHGCKIANLVLRVKVHHFSKARQVLCFVCNGVFSNEAIQFQLRLSVLEKKTYPPMTSFFCAGEVVTKDSSGWKVLKTSQE